MHHRTDRGSSFGQRSNPVSARIQGLLLAQDGRSDGELAISIYGSELRQPLVRNQCALLVRLGQIERRTRDDGRMGNFLLR
jgi:hypothetical protein